MKQIIIIFAAISLFSACSCNRNSTPNLDVNNLDSIREQYKEPMMEWNHAKVRDQDIMIQKYSERRNWEMTRTGSGLFYEIYEKGEGMPADSGMIAILDYKLHLLDGKFCYSSDSTGLKRVHIGRAEFESGLEEALLFMKIGDKAHVILPPHLAYGLPGDGNMIPPDAILVYDIELKELY